MCDHGQRIGRKLTVIQNNNKFLIFDAQYALLRMKENWKTQLNKRKKIGVIIMDLSMAFDTLNHNLLVAKLKAYCLNLSAASFIKS